MTKRLLEDRERNFAPLQAEQPSVVLDVHPGGEFIAMQVRPKNDVVGARAAIWSTKTRKIVWAPKNVNAICWAASGKKLLLVRESHQRQPGKHKIIVTPLQSEFAHFFERRSWPEKKRFAQCPIDLPTGWVVDLVASAAGMLACYVWNDQQEAGIELVSIAGNIARQLPGQGYYGKESNLLEGPSFSPDSRYLVFTYGKYAWWSPDDPANPSRGGQCQVGWIVVGDLEARNYRVSEVQTVIPKGWRPDDPNDYCNMLISCPTFSDRDNFKVVLPTGEERYFAVSN
jgi:hypothetical protein